MEQVDKGLIPTERVEDSELHHIVVEVKEAKQKTQDTVEEEHQPVLEISDLQKEEEWQTVKTRRKLALLKKDGVGEVKKRYGSGSALNSFNG
ncbi:hypothetical protein RIF29_10164 [Crotalaria pallida]|uniref:Uncharacterized protein n=1 Tax=Crotalaria pallida TaxID=3830 RepID=A0AAN9FYQ6_CROPI